MKIDQGAQDFYATLSGFYDLFSRHGNNYNQVVKAVNTHFSRKAIPGQLVQLCRLTKTMHAVCQQILDIAADFGERNQPTGEPEQDAHDA